MLLGIGLSVSARGGGGSGAPVLSSIDPDVGDTSGSHAGVITVTGSGIVSGGSLDVTFGGTSATSVTYVNATTVTCKPPAKTTGTYDVILVNGDGVPSNTLTNAYRAWTPSEITGIDAYLDAQLGVTVSGSDVTQWLDQSSAARTFTGDTNKPTRVADVFGTGFYGIRYVQTQSVSLAATRTFVAGYSTLWVMKWTSTDAISTWSNVVPLSFFGDASGWGVYGASAGNLAGRWNSSALATRGSGLNDGTTRLVGWVRISGSAVAQAYVGTTQQGTDVSQTYSANEGMRSIGRSAARPNDDGFIGDVAAVIVTTGAIDGTDFARLHKWARLRYGAAA